jgi:hypothetical protein
MDTFEHLSYTLILYNGGHFVGRVLKYHISDLSIPAVWEGIRFELKHIYSQYKSLFTDPITGTKILKLFGIPLLLGLISGTVPEFSSKVVFGLGFLFGYLFESLDIFIPNMTKE